MQGKKQVILDCERMKYPHTGLYHFCLQLGKALLVSMQQDETITFYTDKKNKGIFGKEQQYLIQNPVHKIFLPSLQKYNVWHATHQHSMYQPDTRKTPVVLTVHDLNFLKGGLKNTAKQKTYLKKLQQKVNNAHHIVAISKFVLNDLQQNIDTGNKPVSVIYNGCNITILPDLMPSAFVPQQPFLFTIGTIAEKKNFHVLSKLLVNQSFHLLIAGVVQDKVYQRKIMETASQLGVADKIHFTGAVSENDKQWYYQHCTAFVFPSIAEGFGLPVIEAMAFGKPVFLSAETSLPEIGGEAAFYFHDFELNTMQQTFTEGLRLYQEADMEAVIKSHAQKFDWLTTAEQYLHIYRSLY